MFDALRSLPYNNYVCLCAVTGKPEDAAGLDGEFLSESNAKFQGKNLTRTNIGHEKRVRHDKKYDRLWQSRVTG